MATFVVPFVEEEEILRFASIYPYSSICNGKNVNYKLLDAIHNVPSNLALSDAEIESLDPSEYYGGCADDNDPFFNDSIVVDEDEGVLTSLEPVTKKRKVTETEQDDETDEEVRPKPSKRKHSKHESSKHSSKKRTDKEKKKKHHRSKNHENGNSNFDFADVRDNSIVESNLHHEIVKRNKPFDYRLDDPSFEVSDLQELENSTLPLNRVLGLDSAKKLLLNIIGKPWLCSGVFRGLYEPSKMACIYGASGSGKRTLVRSFCREMGLNLIKVRSTMQFNGMMTSLLNYAYNHPCVIYFDHCDHWFRDGNDGNFGREFFHHYKTLQLHNSDVWVIFGTVMPPEAFFPDHRQNLITNSCYAHPLNKKEREKFIHRVLNRQYSMMGGSKLQMEAYCTLILELSEASRFCTTHNILNYCRSVFCDKLQSTPISILRGSEALISTDLHPDLNDFFSRIIKLGETKILSGCEYRLNEHGIFWNIEKKLFKESHSDVKGLYSHLYQNQSYNRNSGMDGGIPGSVGSRPSTPRIPSPALSSRRDELNSKPDSVRRLTDSPLRHSSSFVEEGSRSSPPKTDLRGSSGNLAAVPGRKSSHYDVVDVSNLIPLGESKRAKAAELKQKTASPLSESSSMLGKRNFSELSALVS